MNLMVFAIKDLKTEQFRQPFFTQNEMVAIRMLSIPVTEEGSELNRFSEDFMLIQLGMFDDETGEIKPTKLRQVCGLDAIKKDYRSKTPINPEGGQQ